MRGLAKMELFGQRGRHPSDNSEHSHPQSNGRQQEMLEITDHVPPLHVAAMDIGAISIVLGSFFGFLPHIAAGLAAIWYCVMLYDRFYRGHKSKDE